jgi:hypothetical protein
MKSIFGAALAAAALSLSVSATAAEIYKDYVASTETYNVTFVHVNPNRIDDYLDGLRQTWMSSCDAQKKVGVTLECEIFVSTTAANRDFNVMLVMKSPNAAAGDPNEKRYNELMATIRAKLAEDKEKSIVTGYEEMRSFFGEQVFRQITFK